jgi:eukaryotic-like serine/threonine-protein kinase
MREAEGGATGASATLADTAAAEAQLFDALCELEGDALKLRLGEIEHENAALAARLRRLLTIDAEYAEHTARMIAGDDLPDPNGRIGEGDEIGAFRLLRKIGRGGMGVVYLAERHRDFEQRVAIKLMPRFAIDARNRERFAQERRLLAQLRHPSICSIVDGGELHDGTPWLAMEYVPGEGLIGWCARNAVPLRERIELFLQLCDAVQYAHQRLVIHRDIKDSNVLIETLSDGRANVKLLDFGIAKSLEDADGDERTAMQYRFFSPMTAAPEQIRGDRATVAVDVYALGALLHQLLCGVLPFAQPRRDPAELQRAILEAVPPKMSEALAHTARTKTGTITSGTSGPATIAPDMLRGELDAIVAQCLRKAPEERYPDVGALARDLRAWLSGHPISISADDRLYRLGKFLRRNRLPAALTSAAAFSVLMALGITLWQAAELREQRDAAQAAQRRSEIDRDRARAVADFMRDTFEQADPGRASEGGLLARELIVRGRRRLDRLEGQRDVQAELALLLSESNAAMGLTQESDTIYREHAETIAALSSADPVLQWRARLLRLSNAIVLSKDDSNLDAELAQLGRLGDSPEKQLQVTYLRRQLHARRSEFELAARTLEDAWQRYAASLDESENLRLRIQLGESLLNANRMGDAERIATSIDLDTLSRYEPELQIGALRFMARESQKRENDPKRQGVVIARWLEIAERLYGSESPATASAYVWTVGVIDDPAEQERLMRKAYAIQTATLPPVSGALARAEFNMAAYYLDLRGRIDLAEPHLARAADIGRRAASREHADVRRFEVAWAKALNALGRHRLCLERLSDPPGVPENENDAKVLSALRLELAKAAIAGGQPGLARTQAAAIRLLWPHQGQAMPVKLAAEWEALIHRIAPSDER